MGSRTSRFHLPSEIIREIFLLLPIESVFACKLVSKEWKNLLEDSNFVKLYKADSAAFFLDKGVLNCFFLNTIEKSCEPRQIPKQIESSEYDHRLELLWEASNKIACVKTEYNQFFLYNLLTGDLRVVEDAPTRSYFLPIWSFTGFGYDPCEDDYKIILICKSTLRHKISGIDRARFNLPKAVNKHDTKRSLIFIYSYKKGSWKHKEGFEDAEYGWTMWGNRGFAINGALHWIVVRSDFTRHIASLDLNTYGLVEFKIPSISRYDTMCSNSNLAAFNGNLCCFVDGSILDVWVMEEYGVAKSWTKLLSIGLSDVETFFKWYDCKDMQLYQDEDSGEIIVLMHNQFKYRLFGFDAKKNERRAYIKTLKRRSDNKVQVQSLRTRLKKACCLQPHT